MTLCESSLNLMTDFFKDVITAGLDPASCYWEKAGLSIESADKF